MRKNVKRIKIKVLEWRRERAANWFQIPLHGKRNLKRLIQNGSTDVYLLKRTIEIDTD